MSGGDQRGWETVCFRVPPHEKALLLRIVKEQSEQMGRRVSMSEVLRYLVRATLRKEGVPYSALISNIEEEVSRQTFFCAAALTHLIGKPNIVRQMREHALKKMRRLKEDDLCSR